MSGARPADFAHPALPAGSLSGSITQCVGGHGVYAVFLLMLVDSVFPAASELVMVYGGALAAGTFRGQHVVLFGNRVSSHPSAYLLIALAGTLGYLVGSWLGWGLGALGGRALVERHGRLVHLKPRNLDRAEAWFRRHGALAVLLGRLTPVVRSFVSIPAGLARMALGSYTLQTLLGSAIWCFALAGAGWVLGASYRRFHHTFDYISIAIVIAAVAVLALLWRRRSVRSVR